MKKLIALLLSLTMAASMAACGNTTPPEPSNTFAESQAATEAAPTEAQPTKQVEEHPASRATSSALVHLTGDGQFGFGEGYVLGYNDNGIYTFKNIKYGNAERFKHSTPNTEYGTADQPSFAISNGPVPPQGDTRTVNGKGGSVPFLTPSDSDMFSNEADCLNLNVWSNTLDANAKKPVLVFMHGGGYGSGSSIELESYNGRSFTDYTGVVFVSVNARLNVLGYRDLSAIGGDANLSLSDMVLSLEWVKDNIAKFGGDPDNVTIMGQSGGGQKVSALASCPKAQEEDLFQKVVISSGFGASAGTPEAQVEAAAETVENVKNSEAFLDYLRADSTVTDATTVGDLKKMAQNASDDDVFRFLQTVDYDTLLNIGISNGGSFTADGVYFDKAGNLTDENGVLNETARNYTYLVGHTWGEMGMGSSDGGIVMETPTLFVENLSEEQQKTAMEEWLENRVGDYEETKAAFEKVFPGHIFYDLRAAGDRINLSNPDYAMAHGTLDGGVNYYRGMAGSVNAGNKVYSYFGAYTMPMLGGTVMLHTVDLTYFFHCLQTAPYQVQGDEANAWKVADTMASALAAFCANGDPSTAALPVEPITSEQSYTVVFDVDSRCVASDFDADLLALIAEK